MSASMSRKTQAELLTSLARLSLATTPVSRRAATKCAAASSLVSELPSQSASPRLFSTSSRHHLASEAPAAAQVAQDSVASSSSAPPVTPPQWTPSSRRVGLLARKRGMATYFLSTGQSVPCTVLQVDANQISAHIGFAPATPPPTHAENGTPLKVPKVAPYLALQVAATDVRSSKGISKSVAGHLRKAGIRTPKKVLREFKITSDALLPLGTVLSASHFVPGQAVDVSATSRGKGFQGGMKRHGFAGLRASHGVSISHRSHGSTGQHQDPGRVFPGKKMAGRMGGQRATVHNLKVLRVDLDRQLILVQGNVPGPDGGIVEMQDARRALLQKSISNFYKKRLSGTAALPAGLAGLPFPAGTSETEQGLPRVVEWTGGVEAAEASG